MPSSERSKHTAKQNGSSIKAKVYETELTFSWILGHQNSYASPKKLFGAFDRKAKNYDWNFKYMNKRTVLAVVEAPLVPENETYPGKNGIIEQSNSPWDSGTLL